jgi:hypothetical protein
MNRYIKLRFQFQLAPLHHGGGGVGGAPAAVGAGTAGAAAAAESTPPAAAGGTAAAASAVGSDLPTDHPAAPDPSKVRALQVDPMLTPGLPRVDP